MFVVKVWGTGTSSFWRNWWVTRSTALRKCARICQSLADCNFFSVGADFEDNKRSVPVEVECATGFRKESGHRMEEDISKHNIDCASCAETCYALKTCFAYECSPTATVRSCYLYRQQKRLPKNTSVKKDDFIFCSRSCGPNYVYNWRGWINSGHDRGDVGDLSQVRIATREHAYVLVY